MFAMTSGKYHRQSLPLSLRAPSCFSLWPHVVTPSHLGPLVPLPLLHTSTWSLLRWALPSPATLCNPTRPSTVLCDTCLYSFPSSYCLLWPSLLFFQASSTHTYPFPQWGVQLTTAQEQLTSVLLHYLLGFSRLGTQKGPNSSQTQAFSHLNQCLGYHRQQTDQVTVCEPSSHLINFLHYLKIIYFLKYVSMASSSSMQVSLKHQRI